MKNSRRIFGLFIFLEFLIILVSILLYGFTHEALQTTTRLSGRISLVVFSLIFLLKHQDDHAERWISDKPYLLFAVVHGIHLVELLTLALLSAGTFIPIRLLGGFLAYALIFLMPWFASRHIEGKMDAKKFLRIEIFFLSYVWFIFFMTYLPRVMGKLPHVSGTYETYVILFIWVIVMLIWKLFSIFKFSPARNT